MSDIVIREVTSAVTTFSRPFAALKFLPVGGRSTAVRLRNGRVWVLASTPITPETKSTINEMGEVGWIMAGDAGHHMYLGEFKKEWPNAKVIGVETLVEKKKAEGLKFDGVYGTDPSDTKYGFEDEIQACYFSKYKTKDVAFLHVESKTLIQADLLFNLPGSEQYSKVKSSGKVPLIGSLSPYGGMHKRMVWSSGTDKDIMRRDVKTVASWDFERIIPCHGDVIEKDAKKAWTTAYSKYLD